MAHSRGGSSLRGKARGASRGSSRGRSRPSSFSSQQASFRHPRKPASEWHSDGSQRRLTISSSRPSSQPSSRPASRKSTSRNLFLTPETRLRPPPTSRSEPDDPDESSDHVIMAIDIKERGAVGCAYYVAREERLFCMGDVPKGGSETVDKLKVDIQPTILILSACLDAILNDGRASGTSSLNDDSGLDRLPLPYEVELRPNPDFDYDRALNKLANLGTLRADTTGQLLTPGDTDNLDEVGLSGQQGAVAQIPAWLDLESRVSIGCAGAIIAFLQRRRLAEYLQDDPDAQLAYRISYLEMFTLKHTMFVNTDTLSSLQIILPESHPNAFNQGPGAKGAKESLSVFGLFQRLAKTPQGKVRLRQIFLTPSTDIETIIARQDFVAVFARPDNQPVSEQLSKSFSKIKNMRNTLSMLHRGIEAGNKFGSFKSGVWSSLLEFCYYAIEIVQGLHEVAEIDSLALCARAAEVLDPHALWRIGKMIHDIVDLELSEEQHRTVVKRGVERALDEMKDVYDGMDELLSRIAQDVARAMPAEVHCQINVIFFPQLGFHITVPLDEHSRQPVWSGDESWERMFTTNNMAYFKETRMRQMDSDIGDMWASICDVEIEIVHDLAQRVLQDEDFLVRASDLCGELDCLLALAHGAIQFNLTRPRFVEDNVISIKCGRNLLQEMSVSSYVANDTNIAGGRGDGLVPENKSPSVLVLTGPNYSGKSVYQNGVATIVYMAHIGGFVPCDQCILGITDTILTRITTMETVSKAQSAFMIDLQQIALALNSCTRQSLLVIDEFGKGTDTCDGAGLAAGVLQHLVDLGPECPKVLAATHFHEIFELGLFEDEPNLAHAHMQVHVNDRIAGADLAGMDEVVYLYQLQPGRSMLSYGAQCAAMHGVPKPVVQRAITLCDSVAKGDDLVAFCSDIGAAEMEDLVVAEEVSRRFCAEDFEGRTYDEADQDAAANVEQLLERVLVGLGTAEVEQSTTDRS